MTTRVRIELTTNGQRTGNGRRTAWAFGGREGRRRRRVPGDGTTTESRPRPPSGRARSRRQGRCNSLATAAVVMHGSERVVPRPTSHVQRSTPMRILWTLFKIILGLAIAIPVGLLVLAL